MPLIVFPHGGPESRDYAGFDWMAQALASMGYAVLQPNFRGSDGYGADFLQAGYGQWGRKMQTDLSDGVAFLAGNHTIDPARVCIVGASYGGYAALAGVTLQHGIYRCAVSLAGISDVSAFPDWKVQRNGQRSGVIRYWTRYLGVERYDDPALRAISPALNVGGDQTPVLLIHGRDDTTVPYAQSTEMQHALSGAGRPVQLVDLQEEDHFLSRDATRVQAIRAVAAFLGQYNPAN